MHSYRFIFLSLWRRFQTAATAAIAGALLTTALPSAGQAQTQLRAWQDYQIIMWVGDSVWKQPDKVPLFIRRLKEMGVTAAMVTGDQDAKPWTDAGMPYYVENIVNRGLCLKWNSPVKDWNATVTDWAKGGRPESALVRPYGLHDPAWRAEGRKRVTDAVKKHAANAPLAYDLRDELSTTISANPFDYDFGEHSLQGFRKWLQGEYREISALNAQWGTDFASWEDVRPFTTDRIKNRMASGDALPRGNPDWQAVAALKFDPATAVKEPMRWNFAPWADFRTWMDMSLADALDDFRQTARKLDPATPVGIEGTQMPHAFGGYDLARLSAVLDWVEPYDICGAREIFGSFMPGKPILCTVGEQDAQAARRRLWHLRLLGDAGCIVWWSEDCIDWGAADYSLTKRAVALGAVFREMRSPLAQLFNRAVREKDNIFIHYSQPSVQVAWLLESTVDGSTWLRRFSSYESSHNRHAKVRAAWMTALHDLGWTPQFSTEIQPSAAANILPQSWAMSDAELSAAKAAAGSSVVLTNGSAGVFDQHGTLRREGGLTSESPWHAQQLSGTAFTAMELDKLPAARLAAAPDVRFHDWIASCLKSKPPVQIAPAHRVRIHRYTLPANAGVRLIALERNVDWQMSESLSQSGGNEALEKSITIPVKLATPGHIYDLRTGKKLAEGTEFTCTVEPWAPALLGVFTSNAEAAAMLKDVK